MSDFTDKETKELMNDLFEFQLGDIVYFKVHCDCIWGISRPVPAIIVERLLQQCPGGFQQSYLVSPSGQKSVRSNEIQLTKDRPKMRFKTDEEIDAEVKEISKAEEALILIRKKHRVDSWKTMAERTTKEEEKPDA